MNSQIQSLKHSLKTIFGMIMLAILAAALVSSASIGKAQAGKMGGGVRATPATMAVQTGPSRFNHVANEVRPSQKPSVAKEPCRGRRCGNPWHDHTH